MSKYLAVGNKSGNHLLVLALYFFSFAFQLSVAAAQVVDDMIVEYPTGLIVDRAEDLTGIARVPEYRSFLPSYVDLAKSFPKPGNQGATMGSCVGWAVGYAARSYFSWTSEGRDVKSPANISSPQFIYDSIKSPGNCKTTGSHISEALNLLKRGSLSHREYPPSSTSCAPPSLAQSARAIDFRIDDWEVIDVSGPRFLDQIKGQLFQKHPVIIGMKITTAFHGLKFGQVYRSKCVEGGDCGSHAMVIVGYDETRQAFKLINSWSNRWAERGFGWISYESARTELQSAYVMRVDKAPPPEPVPTCSVAVKPRTVGKGESAELEWSSKHSVHATFDNGLGVLPPKGSMTISPLTTTTYAGAFTNRAGQKVVCSATVKVADPPAIPKPPVVAFFRAAPSSVQRGEASQLSWTVTPGSVVSIGQVQGILKGTSVSVSPNVSTTYKLTAKNAAGMVTAATRVTVLVPPPPTCVLSAASRSIRRGGSTTLRYRSTNSTGGTIDNGVGQVSPAGVETISPLATTTFTGTFSGPGGLATCAVEVVVNVPEPTAELPKIRAFRAMPPEVRAGETSVLVWDTVHATTVTLSDGIGIVQGNSIVITPEETKQFILTATNTSGSTSAAVTVTVSGAGPVFLPEDSCGKISATMVRGVRTVTGFVGEHRDIEAIRAQDPAADLKLSVRPWPQCEALLTLDKALNREDRPAVTIRRAKGDYLYAGEPLVFDVVTPKYPSYLHVAYLQADGSVLNLVQPGSNSFTAYKPRSEVVLGEQGARFRVSEPFGREMLIVLAARSPIFPEARPAQETEREFLTAVRRALTLKTNPLVPDREIAASFDSIVTQNVQVIK